MSLIATVLFKEPSFGTWVHTFGCNFPMALCWQMFWGGRLQISAQSCYDTYHKTRKERVQKE